MRSVRFRSRAIQNILTQNEYLAEHAPHVVEPLRSDLAKIVSLIQAFPDAGHVGTVSGTREIISIKFRYIAVYVVHDDWLEVLRFYFRGQGR